MEVTNEFVCFMILFFSSVCGDSVPHVEYKNEIVGNPDDFAKIVRPCQIYDLNCIRHFFADHSQCKIAKGPVPNSVIRDQSSVYVPRVNLSVILVDFETSGLNARIEEFYINKATNKLLIALEFRNFTVVVRDAYFKFFRNGREPVTITDFTSIVYQSIVITTIIPNIDDLQLDKAEITTFINDAIAPFTIGPKVAASSDPTVQTAVTELLADIPTNLREIFLTFGPYYPVNYIQNNICDFGLKAM